MPKMRIFRLLDAILNVIWHRVDYLSEQDPDANAAYDDDISDFVEVWVDLTRQLTTVGGIVKAAIVMAVRDWRATAFTRQRFHAVVLVSLQLPLQVSQKGKTASQTVLAGWLR